MSRRTTLLAALAVGVTLVPLTACGSEDAAAENAAADGAAAGAFPVTIDHLWGSTTIEEEPERVVVLGVTDSDPVLALGTVPVAVQPYTFYSETGVGPWAEEYLQGQELEVIPSTGEVDVEQVAAYDPDLIVGVSAGFDEAVYEQLSQIAPTLVRPAGTRAYGVPRDDATRMIARALGKEDEAEELIAEADAAVADAVAENPQFQGATATVLLPFSGVYGAYLPADARGQFMTELGFEVPAPILAEDDGETFYVELSQERLDLADGDVLVVLTDEASRAVVEQDAVLQQLPVVQDGGLVLPDLDVRGAMTYNTVLSAPYAVEELTPLLRDALAATS
ncbi:iron-siderophore ABC transporter substrate-binding protein [Modestobacter roseus]|uniref:Iron complex transport system substrate-binding protein n=1 Tax=Modestobacter roseus TaxID=1181884 RepID=A0A562IUY8_9ACTN|nr:iron-siderophore ABC transporter substrate-binding protein [Modestobacter roseus]MQA33605.1 ABC transporter substrate-binding protein [Modestobacter roseus]TWH74762.1 iron complex transport system substrate-binding protein [Modestobacter roseus]